MADKDGWLRRLLGISRTARVTTQDREVGAFLSQLSREVGQPIPMGKAFSGVIENGIVVNGIYYKPTPFGIARSGVLPMGTAVESSVARVGSAVPPKFSTSVIPRSRIAREPPRPGEESEYGQEISTPNSTNVFSFSYYRPSGTKTDTLYVTFKAHEVHASGVTEGHRTYGGRKSRRQLLGRRGATVGGKTGGRGATYAYMNVPPSVYRRLLAVKDSGDQHGPGVKSPGTGVWDMLRIRGTIHGHHYRHSLVQGQVTPSVGGVYIPRRATEKGYRTRSIGEIGRGQRGFQTSTLPQQNGFSTRRRT